MNQILEAAAAVATAPAVTRTDLPTTPSLMPTTTSAETTNSTSLETPMSTGYHNRPFEHRGIASTALIVSAVSGGLLILTILGLLIWCVLRARRRRRCRDRLSDTEIALKQSIGGRNRDSHPRSSSSSEKNGSSFNGQSSYQIHPATSSMTMMVDELESTAGSNRSTLLETSSSVTGKVTYPPKAKTSPKLSTATRGSRFPRSNAVGGTQSSSIPSNGQSLLPPPRQQHHSTHDSTYYPHVHQPQPRQPGKQSPVDGVTPLESFYHDMINAPETPSSPPPPEQARRLVLSSKHAVPLPLPFTSSFSSSTTTLTSPSKAGPESTKPAATASTHKKSASMSSSPATASTITSPRSATVALDWPRVSKEHMPPPPPPPSMPPPAIPEIISNPLIFPELTTTTVSASAASGDNPSSPSTVQSPTSPTQVPPTPTTARKTNRSRAATESSVKSPRSSNSGANRSSNGHAVESMQQQQLLQDSSRGASSKLASPETASASLGQSAILTVPARSGPGHRRTKSNVLTLDSVVMPIYVPASAASATTSFSAFPSPPGTNPSPSIPLRAMARTQDRKPPVSSVLEPTKSLGPMTVQVPRPTSWHLKVEEGGGMVAVAGASAGAAPGAGAAAGAGGKGEEQAAPLQRNIREAVADSRREGVVHAPSYSYL
ncbi:hypothetical protein EMPS_02704 [Entomortierella parvispora]|uniref:Uncharacterized protein n=1 Tax=Entomortierella parvispora TaxID=205924 RepID=A0A9P3H5G9_9FUNG|nr:hypothetical protein EMPS_02704 [Entomortierella parvispora]